MAAIFMLENSSGNERTRHIDAKHCFLVDLTAEGFLDVVFTNSANNASDGLSKNVSKEVHERHTPKFMADKSIVDLTVRKHGGCWRCFVTVQFNIGPGLSSQSLRHLIAIILMCLESNRCAIRWWIFLSVPFCFLESPSP